jgi:hypothetical protein
VNPLNSLVNALVSNTTSAMGSPCCHCRFANRCRAAPMVKYRQRWWHVYFHS